jgi:hypothetical protein
MWVLTALHEHFHQLQYTRPGYYQRVAGLDLSGGDETGMWQLNYPFPYESPETAALVMAYRDATLAALAAAGGPEAPTTLAAYHTARADLRAGLSDADYRYMSFQLWQEGVARFTEHAVAAAAVEHHSPSPDFEALPDYVPYAEALVELNAGLDREMADMDLASWRRVVFYPLGAADAMLLDAVRPEWRRRYHDEPFFLEAYHR